MKATTIRFEFLRELHTMAMAIQNGRSFQRRSPHPQPSLRIPVTPENRERLRALRAAEAAEWEAAIAISPTKRPAELQE